MKHIYQRTIRCSALIVFILTSLWLIRSFNICRVETLKDGAKVTINFLMDMDKNRFKDSIQIVSQVPYANQFDCKINWISKNTVSIHLKENNNIKGQKVYLIIKKADTKIPFINKNCKIPIQFESKVTMISEKEERIISTESPFIVKFNTPINENVLSQYLRSDADFYITPVKVKNHLNQEVNDQTQFLFSPKKPLENNRKYLLSFVKGLPAQSGMKLMENIDITLKTDIKPKIVDISPKDGQKWVGLYPKITLSADYPISQAFLTVDNQKIEGVIKDNYDAEFLLSKPLKPNKDYIYKVQVVSYAGELSKEEYIHFRTLPIHEDKVWVEAIIDNKPRIKVYKGTKIVKQVKCINNQMISLPTLGTYYIQGRTKQADGEGYKKDENYLIKINDECILQSYPDDAQEEIKETSFSKNNEIMHYTKIHINQEDAKWIYYNIPDNAMVIIHN